MDCSKNMTQICWEFGCPVHIPMFNVFDQFLKYFVRFSNGLDFRLWPKTGPFDNRKLSHDLNSGLVRISDVNSSYF